MAQAQGTFRPRFASELVDPAAPSRRYPVVEGDYDDAPRAGTGRLRASVPPRIHVSDADMPRRL